MGPKTPALLTDAKKSLMEKFAFSSLLDKHEGLLIASARSQTLLYYVTAVFYKFKFLSVTVRTGVAGIYNVCKVDEWTGNPAEPPGYQSPLTGMLMRATKMHLKVLK